jgi:hypothetical protein
MIMICYHVQPRRRDGDHGQQQRMQAGENVEEETHLVPIDLLSSMAEERSESAVALPHVEASTSDDEKDDK